MSTTELNKMVDGTYDRRIRELAADLANMVASGEMTEIDANSFLAAKQDAWSDSPWG
jgi:hypothetical protein